MNEPLVLVAQHQTAGKGQFDRQWDSESGENLLCSFYVPGPVFPASSAFHISMIAALSVVGVLKEKEIEAMVKWPNDILVDMEKICGILIENVIKDQYVGGSIVGIGLNVNQSRFQIENATSMYLRAGMAFSLEDVLKGLAQTISCWIDDYVHQPSALTSRYLSTLYGYGQVVPAIIGDKEVQCEIKNVLNDGRLVVQMDGEEHTFMQGDIKLMR